MADETQFVAAEAFRSLRTSVSVLAKEREIFNSFGNSTMRGSGLHHSKGSPGEYQGNMPC